MFCKSTLIAIAGLVTLALPATAQNVRSYRCDDGVRPFTVNITAVDQRTINASNIDGRPRTMRITQEFNGELTFGGGRGNEYNMTFNARGDRASLNKPNSETIECALTRTAQAAPSQGGGPGAVDPGKKPGWCNNPRNAAQVAVCDSNELSTLDGVVSVA
ncbi:MAG: hypothetical protein ACRCWO_01350, partial [Bosea sp. (in: a-proteobacteria)]